VATVVPRTRKIGAHLQKTEQHGVAKNFMAVVFASKLSNLVYDARGAKLEGPGKEGIIGNEIAAASIRTCQSKGLPLSF
jgi:hypothetical protein